MDVKGFVAVLALVMLGLAKPTVVFDAVITIRAAPTVASIIVTDVD